MFSLWCLCDCLLEGCYKTCYRPQTKFTKVMFSQVSVCPQGGGLSLCPGGSLSRGVSVQGVSVQGGLFMSCHVMSCHGDLPYSNERAVRILLECILVWFVNISCNLKNSQTKLCFRTFRASLWPPPLPPPALSWAQTDRKMVLKHPVVFTSFIYHSLSIYLSICLYINFFYLSIYLSLQLSIYPSLHLA